MKIDACHRRQRHDCGRDEDPDKDRDRPRGIVIFTRRRSVADNGEFLPARLNNSSNPTTNMAIATMPKSEGANSRARMMVLTNPVSLIAQRSRIIHIEP